MSTYIRTRHCLLTTHYSLLILFIAYCFSLLITHHSLLILLTAYCLLLLITHLIGRYVQVLIGHIVVVIRSINMNSIYFSCLCGEGLIEHIILTVKMVFKMYQVATGIIGYNQVHHMNTGFVGNVGTDRYHLPLGIHLVRCRTVQGDHRGCCI